MIRINDNSGYLYLANQGNISYFININTYKIYKAEPKSKFIAGIMRTSSASAAPFSSALGLAVAGLVIHTNLLINLIIVLGILTASVFLTYLLSNIEKKIKWTYTEVKFDSHLRTTLLKQVSRGHNILLGVILVFAPITVICGIIFVVTSDIRILVAYCLGSISVLISYEQLREMKARHRVVGKLLTTLNS
jgi:hypothetical protein